MICFDYGFNRFASISCACSRVAIVMVTPPSIRAISSMRCASSSTSMVECVAPSLVVLDTRQWCAPCAATCGKCVTHSTWRFCPICASKRPTTSATAPPMPESTSSKISVGVAVAVDVMTEIASAMRASSPPLAILASGRNVVPA